jgi:hypothetical protein
VLHVCNIFIKLHAGVYEEEDKDEEEDTESLSQRIKRLKGGELESGKGDVHAQSNLVSTMGNDQQKPSSVKIKVQVATTGKMVTKPGDSKVAVLMQESPIVKTERKMSNTPV